MSNPTHPASLDTDALKAEVRRLAEVPNITAAEAQRLDKLCEELEARQARGERIAAAKAKATDRIPGHDSPTFWRQTPTGEVFTTEARTRRESADLALRAADMIAAERGADLRPELRHHLEHHADYAEVMRAQSDPHYFRAWARIITSGDMGRAALDMSDGERQALARVRHAEARAMSLIDTAGGFGLPQLLDPTIVLTSTTGVNPMRNVARIVTGVSDEWKGITSAGITASWDAEGSEVSDDSPSLLQPTVTAHKAAAFIPFSIELEGDFTSLAEQMRVLLAASKDALEGQTFITGDGSGKPYGVVHRLDANTNAEVYTTTAGLIDAAQIYKVYAALPARYRQNAAWMADTSVVNEIRKAGDDKLGNQTVALNAGYDFTLLGRPLVENGYMPVYNATSGSNYTVVGDWSQYVIFDRLASARVELVPHLFGTNGRVTGQRGIYFWWRVGADLISPTGETGMRLLQSV